MPGFILALTLLVASTHAVQAASLAAQPQAEAKDPYAVPDDMLIGAGLAAIQTEGAWDAEGKGESAADHVLHLGKLASMGFTDPHWHDTAADSYHRYREDLAMAGKLKLKVFRFSFSWSRILPTADASKPNPAGVQFYHDYIAEIIKNGMQPMATLYHFDHPQILEDQFHGWQSAKMVPKFKEYAEFVFKEYSSQVKLWTTVNEPNMYCTYFPSVFHASGLYTDEDMNQYECFRNTILGHAQAYRAFKAAGYEGKVGYTALIMHARPNSTRPEDVHAAEAFNQLHAGTLLHPVVHGDFPDLSKTLAGSKLTPFTDEEKALVKGTTDFIGFNNYYGLVATYHDPSQPKPASLPIMGSLTNDIPFGVYSTAGIDSLDLGAIFSMIEPDAIHSASVWLWQSYKKPLVITENGMGDSLGMGLRDQRRAAYHSAFLRSLLDARREFGIDIMAYCAWSLIDSFEWSAAYSRPFGLVHVDYEGGTLDRTLKDSSSFWVQLAETGVVPYVEAPSPSPSPSSAPTPTPASMALLVLVGTLLASPLRSS